MRKFLMMFMMLILSGVFASAQTQVVTGKVTDENGNPIARASVQEKNSKRGTITNSSGDFSFSTTRGTVLVISSTGYNKTEAVVGSESALNFSLKTSNQSLTEVVVTAGGIRREKKALGYAVTTVGSKDLELKPENDVARILNGKVPGVDILNSSGLSGSGTNIIIRGISTIAGGNITPLFIVDGVPFDASTNPSGNFTYGNQSSSRFSDLDPNNIESISVLKGLSAAVLYGDLARNGVVVITTKNGASNRTTKKTEISISQSLFANKVANLPDYQSSYGGGFELAPSLAFSNWGARFKNPPDSFSHPYNKSSLFVAFPEYKGAKYAYQPYNSVEHFFRTGLISNTALNVAGGSGSLRFNGGYSHSYDQGFTPGNQVSKDNLGLGGNVKLSNNFTLSGSVNYATTDYVSPTTSPSFGSSSTNPSIFGDLIYTPRSIDLMGLPYQNPLDGSSVYYRSNNGIQNPRWTAENSLNRSKVYRTYGNAQLKYDIIKNLSALYRVGVDTYNEDNQLTVNKGGRAGGNLDYENGMYRVIASTNKIVDHNFIINYLHDFNQDWNITVDAGGNLRDDSYKQDGQKSTNQLVFGLFNHSNFVNHEAKTESGEVSNYTSHSKRFGVFASTTLGYRNFVYLNLGARESWVSTLEKANRKIFYPSASVSYLPTASINALKNNKYINYMKLRVGYATSARFPDPYLTRSSLNIATNVFVDRTGGVTNQNKISNFLPNPNLKPELLKELEGGIEGKFFSNRITLDFTLYNRKASNQILNRDLDPSTGYTITSINAGNVTNKGIELGLGVIPVRTKNFTWQLDGNFTKNDSKVSNLPDDVKQIVTAGYTNLGNFALNGQPLGLLKGTVGSRYSKDGGVTQGDLLVGSDGYYITASEIGVLGNPYPDYKVSGISTMSFKGLILRAQLDFSKGGNMVALTPASLLARGLAKETDFDRTQPIILPGVDSKGEPNKVQVSPTSAYFNTYFGANEFRTWDATVVRLREVSLAYSLPTKLLSKTPFGNISLVLSGQNLWYKAPNFPKSVHFDPETSSTGVGNGRGLEFLTGPSSKRYGASLRITF